MIVGAHSIIYTKDAAKDRALFRDILGLSHVDVGDGWLIFGLPPSEIAFHPGEENDVHEFYLMTADLAGLQKTLSAKGIASTEPQNMGWGVLTQISLPGGGKLGVYQPRHARPKSVGEGSGGKKGAGKAKKKTAKAAPTKKTAKKRKPVPKRAAKRRKK